MSDIRLDGTVNTRDVGGLPVAGGGTVRSGVLVRSDNLQQLSAADVRYLVDVVGVRRVIDLRTGVEVRLEGPGPLTKEPDVRIDHLSLFPEVGQHTDSPAERDGSPDQVLPWARRPGQRRHTEPDDEVHGWSNQPVARVYLRYLRHRPDSIAAALREIAAAAGTPGATLVHCAAGKDRTGVVVALALDLVGVHREAITADYLATVPHAAALLARLQSSPTYADDVRDTTPADHAPRPETMPAFFAAVDQHLGGAAGYLGRHGWTDADTAMLRQALVDRS